MTNLLRVEHLRYEYGERVAVDSVSLEINKGEIFGLLGPNGAGKTTTISCIAGLLSRWQGEIYFNAEPFRPSLHPKHRGALGIVPQELAVYENLSAAENLLFFAKLCGVNASERRTRVQELLRFAGLEDRQKELVSQFSGGMKRRLNLACGLIHRPTLVLMDEPTVGVDPQSRNHLFESILAIRDTGTSVLYTTHYMEEAERLCDRVAIMNEGKVIACGTPVQLIAELGIPNANLETVFLHKTGRSLRDE